MIDDKKRVAVAEIDAELARISDGGLGNPAFRARAQELLLRRSELTGIIGIPDDEEEWPPAWRRRLDDAYPGPVLPSSDEAWAEATDAMEGRLPVTRADLRDFAEAITSAKGP